MNKKIITGLIALMGISIVGIIIIQLVWMNNAIRVRNELFDRSVNEALTSTTNRLETLQDFRMINHFALGDTANFPEDVPPPPPPPPPAPNQEIEMIVNTEKKKTAFNIESPPKATDLAMDTTRKLYSLIRIVLPKIWIRFTHTVFTKWIRWSDNMTNGTIRHQE